MSKWVAIVIILVCGMVTGGVVFAESKLDETDLLIRSRNKVFFYEENSCRIAPGSEVGSYEDIVVEGDAIDERLADVVRSYGQLAMDLQREWGTPWEVVFAQMSIESGVGTVEDGINVGVARKGYYNWLGITGSGGEFSVGEAYETSDGKKWAMYKTIDNMIKDWAGEYVARNGLYDEAFQYLDPNNYNLRAFLDGFIKAYAPESDGNDPISYVTGVLNTIEGTVKAVREEKGWPSSAELASDEDIPIGGKHPIEVKTENGDSEEDKEDSTGNACKKLTGSPDFKSKGYQERIQNLHDFSQASGYFSGDYICGFDIKGTACGLMSLYAAYYMFSGQGLNDEKVFAGLKTAAMADGYYNCASGEVYYQQFNSAGNLSAYTQIHGKDLYSEFVYSGDHWDILVNELKQGHKVIVNTSTMGGFPTLFTGGGHFMLLDHYNEENDTVFVFDPSMGSTKIGRITGVWQSAVKYDNHLDGIYITRQVMNSSVGPRYALSLTYDGCWNGGLAEVCREEEDGGLKEGGMTYDEAVEFVSDYRAEASKRLRGNYGKGQLHSSSKLGDGFINDAGCEQGTLNNCVAFSQWFINNYTTIGPSFGSTAGSLYTEELINKGGFEDGGQEPQVYAIFSSGSGVGAGDGCVSTTTGKFYNNHTGVILGIDKEKGEVYVGEAGCSAGFTSKMPGVSVYKLEDMKNTGKCGFKYAYPGDKIKLSGGAHFTPSRIKDFNRKWDALGEQDYDELERLAKKKGISKDNFIGMVAWAQFENYEESSYGPYFAYLCNSVGVNNALGFSKKGSDSGWLDKIISWGGGYTKARTTGSQKNTGAYGSGYTQSNLKSVRMALDYTYPDIYGCSGQEEWGGGYVPGAHSPVYDPKGTNGMNGDSLIFTGDAP